MTQAETEQMVLSTGQKLTADRDEMGDPVPSSAGGSQEQWLVFSGCFFGS